MSAQRRRNLVRSRRRVEDEGEEDGSTVADFVDDSQSEGSGPSEVYDDADADDSDLSGTEGTEQVVGDRSQPTVNGVASPVVASQQGQPPPNASSSGINGSFTVAKDTAMMMNGLSKSLPLNGDAEVDFENMGMEESGETVVAQPEDRQLKNGKQETPVERRRREHEEYKRKRDSDPAFIPNRGAFFMHDHRSLATGQNGFQSYARGRGRGKGPSGTPFPPSK